MLIIIINNSMTTAATTTGVSITSNSLFVSGLEIVLVHHDRENNICQKLKDGVAWVINLPTFLTKSPELIELYKTM